jgi:cytochrome c
MRLVAVLLSACGLIVGTACIAESNSGQQAFEKRCGGCHGIDAAREGPALRGVFGRAAGKQPNFPYSDELRAARFTWGKAELDQWLTDPESVVPGTDMAFRLTDKAEREKIISYLQQLK